MCHENKKTIKYSKYKLCITVQLKSHKQLKNKSKTNHKNKSQNQNKRNKKKVKTQSKKIDCWQTFFVCKKKKRKCEKKNNFWIKAVTCA